MNDTDKEKSLEQFIRTHSYWGIKEVWSAAWEQATEVALERARAKIAAHSCVSSCCNAQPSAREAQALADCMFRSLKGPST